MRFNRVQISGAIAGMALLVGSALLPISSSTATQPPQPTEATEEFQIPPGGERVGNQVFYENGNVVLELDSSSVRPFGPRCPRGWFCIFEHAGWRGKMWKFRSRGYWQSLGLYNAHNRMSSYHNRLPYRVSIRYTNQFGESVSSYSKSNYIGSLRNDKAYLIKIH